MIRQSRCGTTVMFVALSIATTGGCNDTQNTQPIDVIAAATGESVSHATKSATPTIVLIGQRIETHGENSFLIVDFVFANPLDVPVSYYGYRMDSWQTRPKVGEISPLYQLKLKDNSDTDWRQGEVGWCGTGADNMVVRAKEAGRFHAHIQMPVHEAQVGFDCTWPIKGVPTKTVIWSPTILGANK